MELQGGSQGGSVKHGHSGALPGSTPMRESIFREFSETISAECGIKLPPSKKVMLESRLRKRLRALNMRTFEEYRDFFFALKNPEEELPHLIDVVTTNTTDFFREPKHFIYLESQVLPGWLSLRRRRPYRVWSAGCSSGEEPYTLGMVLQDFADKNQGFSFSILATDISTEILQKALRAVYPEDKIAKVPESIKKKYLLRSRDRAKRLVRVVPEIRSRVDFRRLNFMESFSLDQEMDAVFFRNVLIYFDRPTQDRILRRICQHIVKGGYLFIGHSESLAGMGLPLIQVAPTIYRKP